MTKQSTPGYREKIDVFAFSESIVATSSVGNTFHSNAWVCTLNRPHNNNNTPNTNKQTHHAAPNIPSALLCHWLDCLFSYIHYPINEYSTVQHTHNNMMYLQLLAVYIFQFSVGVYSWSNPILPFWSHRSSTTLTHISRLQTEESDDQSYIYWYTKFEFWLGDSSRFYHFFV